MKKVILTLILIIGTTWYMRANTELDNKDISQTKKSDSTPTITPILSGPRFSRLSVTEDQQVSLHSNLIDMYSAKEAKENIGCTHLVNAGFYRNDQEKQIGKHIGLFVTEGETISNSISNTLFNAFIYKKDSRYYISQSEPVNPEFALQSGPLLISKGNKQLLNLSSDENARRVVAAITNENNLIFMVFYESSSLISGPLLAELPELVDKVTTDSGYEVKDAINLDGGSHSAFISDEVTLTDIQTPGGYFCIN